MGRTKKTARQAIYDRARVEGRPVVRRQISELDDDEKEIANFVDRGFGPTIWSSNRNEVVGVLETLSEKLCTEQRLDDDEDETDDDVKKAKKNCHFAYSEGLPLYLKLAMDRFPHEEHVQIGCIRVLRAISCCVTNPEATKIMTHEFNVPKATVAAMGRFRSLENANPQIFSESCQLLGNLMKTDGCTKEIINVGGLMAITNAMNDHLDSPNIQQSGCFALSRMLSHKNQQVGPRTAGVVPRTAEVIIKEKIFNAGAINTVINAMNGYPEQKLLQLHGCQILHNLAYKGLERCEEVISQILAKGGRLAVQKIFVLDHSNQRLMDAATLAMRTLTPRTS